MTVRKLQYPSMTGLGEIRAQMFVPDEPWAVLQIVHGMAEHIGRYADFAKYLQERGIVVVMHDQAGHGASVEEENHKGYFGHENGRTALIQDIKELHDIAASEYPTLPYILMGHSMGSLLARAYAAFHTQDISALIISGTAGKKPILGIVGIIADIEFKRNGPRKPSERLHKLSFGSYNNAFKPVRTQNDWLSRDNAAVDAYCADPLCGFAFTAEAMRDMFKVMREVEGKRWAAKIPDVPILMFSGDCDPVGGKGAKGVKQVYTWLQKTGHTVTFLLYPGGRHEMLNETNRSEVYKEVYAFLRKYFRD